MSDYPVAMQNLMNILHVASAVFIVGPMAILPMLALRAIRAGDGPQVSALARSTFVLSLASLLVVIFGFGTMGSADAKLHLSITTPWILISLVLYVIALALSLAVVVPIMRRAARRLQETGTRSSVPAGSGTRASGPDGGGSLTVSGRDLGSQYALIAMSSGISAVLLLVVVILMVWKP
jgi:uncharacterized membrane protein